jgi:hypothetical protein
VYQDGSDFPPLYPSYPFIEDILTQAFVFFARNQPLIVGFLNLAQPFTQRVVISCRTRLRALVRLRNSKV